MAGLNIFNRRNNSLDKRIKLTKKLLKVVERNEKYAIADDTKEIKDYLGSQLKFAQEAKTNKELNTNFVPNNRDLRNATLEYLGRTIIDNYNLPNEQQNVTNENDLKKYFTPTKQMIKDLNTVKGEKVYTKDLSDDVRQRDRIRVINQGLNNSISPTNADESRRRPSEKVRNGQIDRETRDKAKEALNNDILRLINEVRQGVTQTQGSTQTQGGTQEQASTQRNYHASTSSPSNGPQIYSPKNPLSNANNPSVDRTPQRVNPSNSTSNDLGRKRNRSIGGN